MRQTTYQVGKQLTLQVFRQSPQVDSEKLRLQKRRERERKAREESAQHRQLVEQVVTGDRAEAKVLKLANQFINDTVVEVATKDKLLAAAGVDPSQYETMNLWN